MELIWIDALDDKAYTEECRKKGVGRDDIDKVDPAEFRDICRGPFRQDRDFFFEMLPDGWIAPDLYNWCTEILLRDDKGCLVKIETDWDEDYFDDSARDYPTISTGDDPADVNSMSVCARYIEKYSKEIDDWYRAHSKED